jgi:hypothetical protein
MDHSKSIQSRPLSPTDTLINGLTGGILAGLGMLVWLLLAGLLAGDAPAIVLERFLIPGQPANMLSSIFIHLGVSAVYGGIFGLLLRLLPQAWRARSGRLLAGLVYGLLLYLLASAIILPGTGSPLAHIPALALASAHLVYGALLGALTRA